jgi:hypothetical protein
MWSPLHEPSRQPPGGRTEAYQHNRIERVARPKTARRHARDLGAVALALIRDVRAVRADSMMSRVTSRSLSAVVVKLSPVASMSSRGDSGIVAAGSGRPFHTALGMQGRCQPDQAARLVPVLRGQKTGLTRSDCSQQRQSSPLPRVSAARRIWPYRDPVMVTLCIDRRDLRDSRPKPAMH